MSADSYASVIERGHVLLYLEGALLEALARHGRIGALDLVTEVSSQECASISDVTIALRRIGNRIAIDRSEGPLMVTPINVTGSHCV